MLTTRKPAGVKHPVRPMQAASPAPVAPTGGEEIPGLPAGCVGHFTGVPGDSPGLLVQDPDAFSGVLPCPAVSFPGVLPAVATVADVIEVVLDGHGVEVGEGLISIPVTGNPEQDRRLAQVLLAVRAQCGPASGIPESVQVPPGYICIAGRLTVTESGGLVASDYVVVDGIEADHGRRPN